MRKVKGYVWAGIEISLRRSIVKASVIYIEKANIRMANKLAFANTFTRWKLRKKNSILPLRVKIGKYWEKEEKFVWHFTPYYLVLFMLFIITYFTSIFLWTLIELK